MPVLGDHAVVLGASMSGLLAARVLADSFRHVTVIERDALPDEPVNRRGVPQGRHAHALLARGALTLGELFPGILDELVADGVPVWDDGELSRLNIRYNDHLMIRTGKAAVDDYKQAAMYQPSRPLLECHVRRRVQTLQNVTILADHDVAELTATSDRTRVTGVRAIDRAGGAERMFTADLVVDAMGRAARTPAFLESLGYGRPAEDHVVVHTTYATQLLRISPDALSEMVVIVSPTAERPAGMFIFRNEDDNWLFTVFGMAGRQPPTDLAGMLTFAESYTPEHVLAAVRAAEPIGPAVQHRLPSSQWRRYDKMRHFPEGLLVCGDAMCSFNPIYGQGMSVAAMEAMALRAALRHGTNGLARRYFRAAAKVINVAWGLGAGSDLAFPGVTGKRTVTMRFTSRFADWVLGACETDAMVNAQFFKVTGLVDPPSRLLNPRFILRVARVNRSRRQRDSQPQPAEAMV